MCPLGKVITSAVYFTVSPETPQIRLAGPKPTIAIALSAPAAQSSMRRLQPPGKRSTIRGQHDDDGGRCIAEGAQKRSEVRRAGRCARNETRIDVVSCVGDYAGWEASSCAGVAPRGCGISGGESDVG